MKMTEDINYEFKDISTLNEINLLKCKLETKSQVLKSISKELIICKKEKDEFKLMAEQLGEKCSLMKRRIERLNSLKGQNEDEMNFGCIDDYNRLVINQNYKKLQDSNKFLNFELNDLRIKLTDAESDIRLLREKNAKLQKRNYSDNLIDNISGDEKQTKANHLIQQIEKLKMRNRELEKDLKLNLDEKEDLIKSRNNFIQKTERLNESLNALMKCDENLRNSENGLNKSKQTIKDSDQFFDIDSILSENKFLKERLKCLEQDTKYHEELIAKYKHALDKTTSTKKKFFELSNLTVNSGKPNDQLNYLNQDIVSTKELNSFIVSNNLDNLELNESTLIQLRKLVLTLFESVSDKSAALNLAKINNKLLGKRINDLERKLKEYESKAKNVRVETIQTKLNEIRSEFDQTKEFDTEFFNECQNDRIKSSSPGELNENLNQNSIEEKRLEEISLHLPNNLQKLVEQELEKLKDDK